MTIDNTPNNDDDDDDSRTTLGDNSESLLAPTPPPKEQSPLQSPATQTLNTLSQSHLLSQHQQDSYHSETHRNNNDHIKRCNLSSTQTKTTSPLSKYCLPWKTRTERRTQQRLMESKHETAAARNESYHGSCDSETTMHELPSTQRLQDRLAETKVHHAESGLHQVADHRETADLPSIKAVQVPIAPPDVLNADKTHLRTSSSVEITSPDATSIRAVWTVQQEEHLQIALQSLSVRVLAFHQPGPLGLTIVRHRLGNNDYCLVEQSDHMDSDSNPISCASTTTTGDLLLFPSDQFIHFENLDMLRREETRPLMVGLARLPPLEELHLSWSTTANTAAAAAAAMVTLSNTSDGAETQPFLKPATVTEMGATRTYQPTQDCIVDSSAEDSHDMAMAISQVLFQAIEILGDPSSPGQRKPVATVTASSNDTVDGKETAPDLLPALPQSDTDQRRSVRRPANNSTPTRQSAVTVAPTSRTMIRKKESNASQATLLESTFVGLETDRQETKIKADYALSRPAEYCDACQSGKQELDRCHHIRCPKNPSFDEARFRRMVKGCNQGCKSCMIEIKNGYTKRRHDMCDLNEDAQTETKATIQPLPFCRACLTKKGLHRQICPQHKHFGTSGAAKKLELLLAGVKIGCQACHTEYESGTASRRLHAGKCERRYQGDRTKHQPNQSKKVIVRGRASSKTKQPVLTELPAANKPAQQKPTKDSDTKENEEIQQAVARSAKKRDRPPKVSSPSPTPRQGQVSEKELQQFCNSCQRQKGCHHALCLHHRNFESSGARGQLELLRAGVDAGCESCRQQYSTGGYPSFSKHHVKCPPLRSDLLILGANDHALFVRRSEDAVSS